MNFSQWVDDTLRAMEATFDRIEEPAAEADESFAGMVADVLQASRDKHPPINSLHEGYAVILEELDEAWDVIKQQNPDREQLLLELAQVAAMCQRMAEDRGLIGR